MTTAIAIPLSEPTMATARMSKQMRLDLGPPCLGTDKLVAVLSSPAMLISSNEESTHEKSGADGDGGLDGGDGGLDGRTENVARRENVAMLLPPPCVRGVNRSEERSL